MSSRANERASERGREEAEVWAFVGAPDDASSDFENFPRGRRGRPRTRVEAVSAGLAAFSGGSQRNNIPPGGLGVERCFIEKASFYG